MRATPSPRDNALNAVSPPPRRPNSPRKLAALEALKKALLHQAFAGAL